MERDGGGERGSHPEEGGKGEERDGAAVAIGHHASHGAVVSNPAIA